MFYLIGVDHRVQAKEKGAALSDEQRAYHACLSDAIKAIRPALVAEEYSQHALAMCAQRTGVEHESVTQLVAGEFGVEHRFCDPDPNARAKMEYMESPEIAMELDWTGLTQQQINDKALAMEIAKQWPKRERFWLAEIAEEATCEVIFILGNGHLESFQGLLDKSRVKWKVWASEIGVRQNDDGVERLKRAKEYLDGHLDLLND